MVPTFKDLSLENGTIIKREKSEDMDFREFIPVKFIAKISTVRVHSKKFRTVSFIMAGITVFFAVASILSGDFSTSALIGTGLGAAFSAFIYFSLYKRNRHLALRIRFSQGDDFKYLYPYSTDEYKQLCSFVDCVLKEISHGSHQVADEEVPEFENAA